MPEGRCVAMPTVQLKKEVFKKIMDRNSTTHVKVSPTTWLTLMEAGIASTTSANLRNLMLVPLHFFKLDSFVYLTKC